jgi:tRNA (adenine57-N1/adenine58-N1)-methyltransferase catalytic subunit
MISLLSVSVSLSSLSLLLLPLSRLKTAQRITVTCTDVCATAPDPSMTQYAHLPVEQQYGFIGCESNSIDAVFLDLPEPWKAIPHAHRILKSGRNICCYSPCMEQVRHIYSSLSHLSLSWNQVNKTCAKLRELQFHSIRMVEVRQRPFEGRSSLFFPHSLIRHRSISFPTPDLGRKEIDSSTSANTTAEEGKDNSEHVEEVFAEDASGAPDGAGVDEEDPMAAAPEGNEEEADPKGKRKRNTYETRALPPQDYLVSRSLTPMKGHTAFLTFAVCPEKRVETAAAAAATMSGGVS